MLKFETKYKQPDRQIVDKICRDYKISPVVAELIINRGFHSDIESFLGEPQFHDPFLLNDMQKAVDCIQKHLENGDLITVFGDYDVDGVSATSILYLYLKSIGAKVDYVLPSRHEDGYGLNTDLLQTIIDRGGKLVITVDCGITSIDEAEFAKENGLDLIITDHHQVLSKLPDAVAVVNPLLNGYPYPLLCGAGVAGKLVHALGGSEEFEKYLDLMALATIADIVLLTGENRCIVQRGLQKMNEDTRTSILALKSVAGIQNAIEVGHVAFGLAPRLNAAGRISSAGEAFSLLIEEDFDKAMRLSKNVDITNKLRQKQEEKIMTEALSMVEETVDLKQDRIILLKSEGWNKGVIGIVSSKLVEKYHRPVILFSQDGDGVLTGSGRSIPGVHLFQLIHQGGELLLKYGGHEMAAGMSVMVDNFEKFKNLLNQYLIQNMEAELFVPTQYYDMELFPKDINLKLVDDLDKLAPMGMGNKTPLFLLRNVRLSSLKLIGENKDHLKFCLLNGKTSIDGVAFSKGHMIDRLKSGKFDCIVSVERNVWNGRETVQIMLKAIRANVENNIETLICGGAPYFVASLSGMGEVQTELDKNRMRKMWRGDVYLCRRVKKDVFGTAIYTSVPDCTRHLLNILKTEGLLSNLDVCYGKPLDETCLVIAPDWDFTELNHKRLVINDYAPSGFVKKVMEYNPEIQVVLCHNEDRERMILEFTSGMLLDRNQLLRYYSTIRQQLLKPTKREDLHSKNPYGLALILETFLELNLLAEDENGLRLVEQSEKKDLMSSGAYQSMLQLDNRVKQELGILLGACNKE